MKEKIFDKEEFIFEGMVSVSAVINSELKCRKITKVLFDRDKIKSKKKQYDYLRAMSSIHGFDIELTDEKTLDSLTVGTTHGGVIAYCTDRKIEEITKDDIKDGGFYVYIEGIEDPYNFGYALRSLYASGVDGVILSPRNWMTAAATVCRASAGASERCPLFISNDGMINIFKEKGYTVLAADKTDDAVSIYDREVKTPVLLVVGGEKRGITRAVLSECDGVVCLDYGRRFGAALSAASAASILAFEIFRQNREQNGEV